MAVNTKQYYTDKAYSGMYRLVKRACQTVEEIKTLSLNMMINMRLRIQDHPQSRCARK